MFDAKSAIRRLRQSLYHDFANAREAVEQAFAPNAKAKLGFPFETLDGGFGLWGVAQAPLAKAWPDLERRDYIVISGEDEHGATWVGCCGAYIGTFANPWLGIPPTGRVTHMRYHEFYRVDGDQVVEMQALWDIPAVMMQAKAWPLAPSLGTEWHVPAPATCDGLGPHDATCSAKARQHIIDMLTAMKRHPSEGGPEVMEMPRYWHPKMNWYGPAGIGTGRGIEGFRKVHQIPFLNAMPDRGKRASDVTYHFFSEGDYVGVTGWPNMLQTLSGGGWLGIAPAGKSIEMRSLDFWRLEDGLIRENWVLVDMLSVYYQIGVDVFARMKEFTPWSNGSA